LPNRMSKHFGARTPGSSFRDLAFQGSTLVAVKRVVEQSFDVPLLVGPPYRAEVRREQVVALQALELTGLAARDYQ
jgi:hypothetical protein